MSQLFGLERSVITKHILNVFKEGELAVKSVCEKFAHSRVALALLIAESAPKQKDLMICLMMPFLEDAHP